MVLHGVAIEMASPLLEDSFNSDASTPMQTIIDTRRGTPGRAALESMYARRY